MTLKKEIEKKLRELDKEKQKLRLMPTSVSAPSTLIIDSQKNILTWVLTRIEEGAKS